MFREAVEPEPLPPCAICAQPGPCGFWGSQLCRNCYADWFESAPMLAELERQHAAARPEDVEAAGKYLHPWDGGPESWVTLKPGVTERVARDAARAWVLSKRTKSLRGQRTEAA